MTASETIRYLRGEHTRIEHPVACCRKDHQNWPCSTIRALDVATAAERERIITVARAMSATYPVTLEPQPGSEASPVRTSFPFADYLEDVPAGRQGQP